MRQRCGFSTGALALGDCLGGLRMLLQRNIPIVELSALRDRELQPLLAIVDTLPLSTFSYVSFHAPSSLSTLSERTASTLLKTLVSREWPIILHPDVFSDYSLWEGFGEWLCIENMDKRKPIGRTVAELELVFERFPQASFCFDIGHARQVDPSMSEAALLARRFGARLKQVHMSEVNSSSRHDPMSLTAIAAFRKVAHLIPPDVPIILETVVPETQIEQQIHLAESVLDVPTLMEV